MSTTSTTPADMHYVACCGSPDSVATYRTFFLKENPRSQSEPRVCSSVFAWSTSRPPAVLEACLSARGAREKPLILADSVTLICADQRAEGCVDLRLFWKTGARAQPRPN